MRDNNNERELMRSYLLGGLAGPRLEEVEIRLLSDARFREELQAVQDELIDGYAFGTLSWGERRQFKSRFLITPERAEKLRFAHAMKAHVGGAGPDESGESSGWPRRLRLPRTLARHKPLFAASVAACLLIVAACIVLVTKARRDDSVRASMARAEKIRAEVGLEVERWTKHPPPDFARSTRVAELRLSSGLTRAAHGADGTRRVTLTDADEIAQIKLELSERRFDSYDAALLTSDESPVFVVSGLRPEDDGRDRVLVIRTPAKSLKAGDYEFRLQGTSTAGDKGDAGRYPFQVTIAAATP
jgi:hypothetical protein